MFRHLAAKVVVLSLFAGTAAQMRAARIVTL
jgi:hypothetical protein